MLKHMLAALKINMSYRNRNIFEPELLHHFISTKDL